MTFRAGFLAATAAISLAGCNGATMTEINDAAVGATATSAEGACMVAVNANMTGGTSTVINSEPSQAGTLVVLRSKDGTNWRCTTTSGGIVRELSVL